MLTYRRPETPPEVGFPDPAPALRPRRRRFNGRAALGGLLVTLAALGTYVAATTDGDAGTVGAVVASRDLPPGTRLAAADLALSEVRLGPATARRVYADPHLVVGAVTLAPIAAGELVQAGAVSRDGDGSRHVSFAIEAARALAGRLGAGDRVDVLATFGSGPEAETAVVAARALVVAVDEGGGALGGAGLVVTVAVPSDEAARAVAHAASAASLTLVRATGAGPADPRPTPAAAGPPSSAAAEGPPPADAGVPPVVVPAP